MTGPLETKGWNADEEPMNAETGADSAVQTGKMLIAEVIGSHLVIFIIPFMEFLFGNFLTVIQAKQTWIQR